MQTTTTGQKLLSVSKVIDAPSYANIKDTIKKNTKSFRAAYGDAEFNVKVHVSPFGRVAVITVGILAILPLICMISASTETYRPLIVTFSYT